MRPKPRWKRSDAAEGRVERVDDVREIFVVVVVVARQGVGDEVPEEAAERGAISATRDHTQYSETSQLRAPMARGGWLASGRAEATRGTRAKLVLTLRCQSRDSTFLS